jgi:transcriptional regulator with XRE-family HTH domain
MDNRDAVSAFLRSRRDKITPEQAGLPAYGQRRVPGLRRGEVATLAGVSVEYHTRLERGNLRGVSDSVLDALAQALRLGDTERMYLYDLRPRRGTCARAEHYILPLLREKKLRLVQLARAGQSLTAGIDVLDDSRSPERLIRRGRWALWDEMEANGTVPQQGGIRKCSIRAKGDVGDLWLKRITDGLPFRQMIGFNADETGRRDRDLSANKLRQRTGVRSRGRGRGRSPVADSAPVCVSW